LACFLTNTNLPLLGIFGVYFLWAWCVCGRLFYFAIFFASAGFLGFVLGYFFDSGFESVAGCVKESRQTSTEVNYRQKKSNKALNSKMQSALAWPFRKAEKSMFTLQQPKQLPNAPHK